MATTATYHPSAESASQFWEAQRSKVSITLKVPDGFPVKLESPLAWTASEINSKQSEWVLQFETHEVDAIDSALTLFEKGKFAKKDKRKDNLQQN